MPVTKSDETKVFLLKTKADFCRYIAESKEGKEKERAIFEATGAYEKAENLAKKYLEPTNPILLGLLLNFAIFYYEIKEDQEIAKKMLQDAFDGYMAYPEKTSEEHYRDSVVVCQLIRDNLNFWSQTPQEQQN